MQKIKRKAVNWKTEIRRENGARRGGHGVGGGGLLFCAPRALGKVGKVDARESRD